MADLRAIEERAARWANIIAALPGCYCAYVLWEQRHRGEPLTMAPALIFAGSMFLLCIAVGATLNFARRERNAKTPLADLRSPQLWDGYASEEIWRANIAYQNKLIELGRSIDGILNPLQIEALQLSNDLLSFLECLGPAPSPKYTARELEAMSSDRTRELINSKDGDYAEACEFHSANAAWFRVTDTGLRGQILPHWKHLLPFYDKAKASYTLEFGDRVARLRNRFTIEGITSDDLLIPVEGRDGTKSIRVIASKLWELAFEAGDKAHGKES